MLADLGFNALEVDQSFYVFKKGGVIIVIWMHVDDGVVSSNCPEAIQNFRHNICSRLDVNWKDSISRIVSLECGFGEDEVTITQQHLTNGILDSYPQAIFHHDAPLPPSPATNLGQKPLVVNATLYCSVIGSLSYLVSGSRPDLAYAVNLLTQHSVGPTENHWLLLDHLVGYLLKTWHMGMTLRPRTLSLNLWSDMGWGGILNAHIPVLSSKLATHPYYGALSVKVWLPFRLAWQSTLHSQIQPSTWCRQFPNYHNCKTIFPKQSTVTTRPWSRCQLTTSHANGCVTWTAHFFLSTMLSKNTTSRSPESRHKICRRTR
ncbi:hypothetical protein O181_038043 [Austropuccinia psidii MF-1]|uniref:Reverse transcriptase Ty1/copia-type domain-containing protein n=1 Tax=Austropuccinia psidii MF-1 TaxID=1389203 RepID=A0A9Q3DCL0_9BASI|nr:hypothetical protein [Austropuccinia psidii MF-1]